MTTDRDYSSKEWLADMQERELEAERDDWFSVMGALGALALVVFGAILVLHLGAM